MSLGENEKRLLKQSSEHVKAVQERRRSSASGYHDTGTKREANRSEAKRKAIDENKEESQ